MGTGLAATQFSNAFPKCIPPSWMPMSGLFRNSIISAPAVEASPYPPRRATIPSLLTALADAHVERL